VGYNTNAISGLSTVRPIILNGNTSNWDIQYPLGTSLRTGGRAPWGYNLGIYQYYSVSEAPAFAAQMQSEGVTIVRLIFRWSGSPAKKVGDSRSIWSPPGTYAGVADLCFNMTNPSNFVKWQVFAQEFAKLGIWVVLALEGDILQSGTQSTAWDGSSFHADSISPDGVYDRALTLVQPGETIPGGLADWGLAGGYNVFTSPFLFKIQRERAKMIARWARSVDYIWALEVLSEPLPPSGTISTALNGRTLGSGSKYYIYPSTGNDGVYGPEWTFRANNTLANSFFGGSPSPGAPNGCLSIEEYARIITADVRAIAPNMKFMYGGRSGYNLDPECQETITALSDPTGLGGNLVAQNIAMFTWDRLGSGTNQVAKSTSIALQAAVMNAPFFVQQLGERVSTDGSKDPGDPNTYGLRGSIRTLKAFGYGGTIWDRRSANATGYGTESANNDGDADGAGGTYTMNTTRQSGLAQAFGERLEALRTAAHNVATANNGALFYVKPDQTNITKTVVGGIGSDTLLTINPVIDPLGLGIVGTAVGTITIDYSQPDGAGGSYLPDKQPVLRSDGSAGNYITFNMSYFGSPGNNNSGTGSGDENMTVIVAGTPSNLAQQQTFICLGNVGTTVRYPQIVSSASHLIIGKVIGDTAGVTLNALNTSTSTGKVPIVASLRKSGNHPSTAVTMWVNGIDDTAPAPGGIGTGENVSGTGNTLTGQTVSTIATLARLRIFGTSNTGDYKGTIAGWFICRNALSDEDVRVIGRFFAALMAGPYKA
jgi:hypothetical protein